MRNKRFCKECSKILFWKSVEVGITLPPKFLFNLFQVPGRRSIVKRILNSLFLAIVVLAVSTSLGAASLTLTGGPSPGTPVAGSIPASVASNHFVGAGNLFPGLSSISGYFGSTVNFSVEGIGSSVTFDFFGGEAGFHDQFLYDSGAGYVMPAGFDHAGDPVTVITPSLAVPLASATFGLSGSGVLKFEYLVNGLAGGATGGPINGSNFLNLPGLPPNFFAACSPLSASVPSGTSCDTLWVFLDDNGAGDDDDYDDYAVRIRVADGERKIDTPEPSSIVLLSGGLLGLGLVGRKFKK
jgi:hypothetical protein